MISFKSISRMLIFKLKWVSIMEMEINNPPLKSSIYNHIKTNRVLDSSTPNIINDFIDRGYDTTSMNDIDDISLYNFSLDNGGIIEYGYDDMYHISRSDDNGFHVFEFKDFAKQHIFNSINI